MLTQTILVCFTKISAILDFDPLYKFEMTFGLCYSTTKHRRCIKLHVHIFEILRTYDKINNLTLFSEKLEHVSIFERIMRNPHGQWRPFSKCHNVAYLEKKNAYGFIKLSAKSHSFNILCTIDVFSCPTRIFFMGLQYFIPSNSVRMVVVESLSTSLPHLITSSLVMVLTLMQSLHKNI